MLVGLIAAALALYLAEPLPEPKVSLVFQGFTIRGTNTYALVCLTNEGYRTVRPTGRGCLETVIETKDGWITNREPPVTVLFFGIRPSSGEVFDVSLPSDSLRWRVTVGYSHYRRHNLREEVFDRLVRSRFWRAVEPFSNAIGWCLDCLPKPSAEYSDVSTSFLTNRPPVAPHSF